MNEATQGQPDGHNPSRRKETITLAAGTLGVYTLFTGALGGLRYLDHRADPVHIYEATFTDNEQCLDGSPFDPEMGAIVSVNEVAGEKTVTVVPKDINTVRRAPAVLSLVVDGSKWSMHKPDIIFSDTATAGLLAEADCPAMPDAPKAR